MEHMGDMSFVKPDGFILSVFYSAVDSMQWMSDEVDKYQGEVSPDDIRSMCDSFPIWINAKVGSWGDVELLQTWFPSASGVAVFLVRSGSGGDGGEVPTLSNPGRFMRAR
jgi:hypothetical protein